jgi:hypothetical protein
LWRRHPQQWASHKLMRLVGNQVVVQALLGGASLRELERLWQADLDLFRQRRARFLRYPDCSAYDSPPISSP